MSQEKVLSSARAMVERGLRDRGGSLQHHRLAQEMKVSLATLRLDGQQIVRDLWRQKDEGKVTDEYSATVASHGVKLLRLRPAK